MDAAELAQRLEVQLSAVRAVLADSMASLQQEHEAATAQLRADNRKLQHARGQARAREAELEERLTQAQQVFSGLAQWTSNTSKVRSDEKEL